MPTVLAMTRRIAWLEFKVDSAYIFFIRKVLSLGHNSGKICWVFIVAMGEMQVTSASWSFVRTSEGALEVTS